jgi:hypothetical protein
MKPRLKLQLRLEVALDNGSKAGVGGGAHSGAGGEAGARDDQSATSEQPPCFPFVPARSRLSSLGIGSGQTQTQWRQPWVSTESEPAGTASIVESNRSEFCFSV